MPRPTLSELKRLRSNVSQHLKRREGVVERSTRDADRLRSELRALDQAIVREEEPKGRLRKTAPKGRP